MPGINEKSPPNTAPEATTNTGTTNTAATSNSTNNSVKKPITWAGRMQHIMVQSFMLGVGIGFGYVVTNLTLALLVAAGVSGKRESAILGKREKSISL
mgnify:CR=1 FL=1